MLRHQVTTHFPRIVAALLTLVLVMAGTSPGIAQTDPYAYRLQERIGQLQAELEFFQAYRLDEPGILSMSGDMYGDMTGRFNDADIVSMPQAEFLRIATEYWAFASEDYLAQGLSFSDFLKSLYAFSDETRDRLRAQVTQIRKDRDAVIYELEQMQDTAPQATPVATDWQGRWTLTRTQRTGHVSSTVGPTFETTLRVTVKPDGHCRAWIFGFDVSLCRLDGTTLYLETRGGWAGDSSIQLYRNGDKLTGTFYSKHPSSGEATGLWAGQRIR